MPLPYEKEPKKKADRPSKEEYFLEMAYVVAKRSTCVILQLGAVIVNDDCVVGTGYNGAARGVPNCCDLGICRRIEASGERVAGHYAHCVSVHAEENAVINAPDKRALVGATIYINSLREKRPGWREYGGMKFPDMFPCSRCMRVLINARLAWVVLPNGMKDCHGHDLPYHKWNIHHYVKNGVFGGL